MSSENLPENTQVRLSRSKRFWALAALLVASIFASYIIYERYLGLGATVLEKDETITTLKAELERKEAFAKADSLLFAGKYKQSLAAFEALTSDEQADSLLVSKIDQRIRHTRWLRRTLIAVDTLNTRLSMIKTDIPAPIVQLSPKPITPTPLIKAQPNQYDSLVFALKTLQTENATLKTRLAKKSASDYLSFKSSKGNDVFYVGQVSRSKANGQGYGLLSTGSRYVGEWKNNKKHGQGEFYWKDGAYYEGEFVNDKREGQGTYHFPSGEVYIGSWKNGSRNGPGVIYSKDKKVVVEGEWKDDELVE